MLMKKSLECVIIIPNYEILDVPIWFSVLRDDENHFQKVLQFSKMYNLGIKLEDGFPAMVLASLGHIVILIDYFEKQTVVYLPENLSIEQGKILNNYKLKKIFKEFDRNWYFAFSIVDSNKMLPPLTDYIENIIPNYEAMYKFINNRLKQGKKM